MSFNNHFSQLTFSIYAWCPWKCHSSRPQRARISPGVLFIDILWYLYFWAESYQCAIGINQPLHELCRPQCCRSSGSTWWCSSHRTRHGHQRSLVGWEESRSETNKMCTGKSCSSEMTSSKDVAPVLWISPPFQALFPPQLPRPSCSHQLPAIMSWFRENQLILMHCPIKAKDYNKLSWLHHNKSVIASPSLHTLSSSSMVSTFFWLLSALSSAFFSSFSRYSSINLSPGRHYNCLLIFYNLLNNPESSANLVKLLLWFWSHELGLRRNILIWL